MYDETVWVQREDLAGFSSALIPEGAKGCFAASCACCLFTSVIIGGGLLAIAGVTTLIYLLTHFGVG